MNLKQKIAERFGIVRMRQLIEELRHHLAFLPLSMTAVAVVASLLTSYFDRTIGPELLTGTLATTVESARVVLGTIAGALITALTLLVSMMLVAVQLASGQFSPRTLRNWLSDSTLQRAVGLVMATAVYCLLGLRWARVVGEDELVPSATVLVALVLGGASLVMVIRAVDHVTSNLQVGTVIDRIATGTLSVIQAVSKLEKEREGSTAAAPSATAVPDSAIVVESTQCGWIQQVDSEALAEALPEGSTSWVHVRHGEFVTRGSPLAWLEASAGHERDDDGEREVEDRVRAAFALGVSRTMQRDIGFGLSQLADIAVRALSPGINDPQTASDVIQQLGEVMLALWNESEEAACVQFENRTIHRRVDGRREYLQIAFDPIRCYGCKDPAVMLTMAKTLVNVANEVERRGLPGSVGPLDDMLAEVREMACVENWLPREREAVETTIDGRQQARARTASLQAP